MSLAQNLARPSARGLAAYQAASADAFLAQGMPVGVVLPYDGVTVPARWLFCAGQAVSRTTYSDLFAALTATVTATTTNLSNTLTAVSLNLTGLGLEGAVIEGSGVPAGTTVVSVTPTTIVMSAGATVGASGVSIRLLPHGRGDGSTTFNLPDRRGRVTAGRDNMGGSAASRLTVSGTGNITSGSAILSALSINTNLLSAGMLVVGVGVPVGTTIASIDSASQVTLSGNASATTTGVALRFAVVDGAGIGQAGGAHTQTLSTPQIPSHSHTTPNVSGRNTVSGGSDNVSMNSTGAGFTTNATGGGQAHTNVQPTFVSNYIIYAGV